MARQQQDEGTEPDASTEPVTMAALGLAVLGLLTGVGALITARRRA
jgi:hypothetical protein